jgi:hypothetical protein
MNQDHTVTYIMVKSHDAALAFMKGLTDHDWTTFSPRLGLQPMIANPRFHLLDASDLPDTAQVVSHDASWARGGRPWIIDQIAKPPSPPLVTMFAPG